MTKIDQTLELSSWFNIYKNLLPEKQRLYISLYLDEDFSLQEIADNFTVSKTAVYDAIKKGIQSLTNFENELHYDALKKKLQYFYDFYSDSENYNEELCRVLANLIEE